MCVNEHSAHHGQDGVVKALCDTVIFWCIDWGWVVLDSPVMQKMLKLGGLVFAAMIGAKNVCVSTVLVGGQEFLKFLKGLGFVVHKVDVSKASVVVNEGDQVGGA